MTVDAPATAFADLPCQRADGGATRLHAELRGRWALLTGDATVARGIAAVARRYLGAEHVTVLMVAGGNADHTVLVRPDAHLAWQGSAADEDGVARWLSSTLHLGTTRRRPQARLSLTEPDVPLGDPSTGRPS